jgi:hypothetical protein
VAMIGFGLFRAHLGKGVVLSIVGYSLLCCW